MFIVFVYGSLRKGLQNHHVMGDSKFLSYGSIYGDLYYDPSTMICFAVPGNKKIYGEIYDCSLKVLYALDDLEGVPGNYQRVKTIAQAPVGPAEVWAYYMRKGEEVGYPPVVSGDWVKFKMAYQERKQAVYAHREFKDVLQILEGK